MFTARNVFSSSLTISATCVELTGTIVSMIERVQRRRELGARFVDAADDLRDVAGVVRDVARIDALGRKRQVEVLARLQAALLERRLHHFVGRPRIRRRLEDDELPRRSRARTASTARIT